MRRSLRLFKRNCLRVPDTKKKHVVGEMQQVFYRHAQKDPSPAQPSSSNQKEGWDAVWESNLTAWEVAGKSANGAEWSQSPPALNDLVKMNDLLPYGKEEGCAARVLVPGCGTGYDVLTLASANAKLGIFRKVDGLDFAELAIQKAKIYANSIIDQRREEEPKLKSMVNFIAADFFKFLPPYKYDLVFDYTQVSLTSSLCRGLHL